MARQLGLRVGRIVIDAGHGGRDPGAQGPGYTEAELTLDIALRLERLLTKEPGVEVVLTRRTDEYVGLQERTAIANSEGADLFLSIHANASRNRNARGIESYLLNFASTPDAAAVAARENASSTLTMSHLNDLVKQIALNSKVDESRDLARNVQNAMVRRLQTSNQQVKDLGVKQAPFVVLVGASMPSVLAEVSFLTHKQEGRLLGTGAYRQRIAEALFDGVRRYLRTLKRAATDTADGIAPAGGTPPPALQ
jgi:N-acetylmuramoyl-L-alanine amidase